MFCVLFFQGTHWNTSRVIRVIPRFLLPTVSVVDDLSKVDVHFPCFWYVDRLGCRQCFVHASCLSANECTYSPRYYYYIHSFLHVSRLLSHVVSLFFHLLVHQFSSSMHSFSDSCLLILLTPCVSHRNHRQVRGTTLPQGIAQKVVTFHNILTLHASSAKLKKGSPPFSSHVYDFFTHHELRQMESLMQRCKNACW